MQFNYEFLLKLELTDFVPTCSYMFLESTTKTTVRFPKLN